MINIYDIEQLLPGLIPKPALESLTGLFKKWSPLRRNFSPDSQRVDPERLHFNRFTNPRGNDLAIDLGVHPGELHTGDAGCQQPIFILVNPVASTFLIAG